MSKTISIEFPSEILLALNESEKEFKKRIKISLAIKLYKTGKLTIGKAAQISGLTRYEFESYLSENKISISDLAFDDVMHDLEKLE